MGHTYNYNNFNYTEVPTKKGELTCEITHNIPKPDSIYKFYSVSKFSVDALLKGYLYASHPYELNDSLDSSVFLIGSKERIDYSYYKRFLGEVYKNEEDLLKFYEQDNVEGYYSHGYILAFWETISNIFGIISMTGIDNNELMWPHYTQEKGFQIKFNTEKLESSIKEKVDEDSCYGLFPINYTKRLNPIDFSDFPNPVIPFFYATNVKSNKWEYEQEWRFLISKHQMGIPRSKSGLSPEKDYEGIKGNRRAFYDRNLVEEITLGHDFFTGREFNIDRTVSEIIIVEPIESKSNWNFQNHIELLEYIHSNLSDRLYYSGRKYEFDSEGVPYLTRTKERMEIEKIDDKKYKLTRTNEFY
ncbi:DUF2971 domain-containing protein [Flavobacteriaceae bacterium S0825]|uniref:DUF2971 domain-containing protein n=1 Tax=Gaetbulibacter sp. S0825 TaxID=2720084 RepID=UPI00143179D8|nr:DUF2971 domain-containing protein [Gaetbulibacter sp. S0825]MCK0108684.1 DUF2971 domain-containing protein [Flavobacteriaceae bacterium S0825]NIX64320.1 DUF2971 domain-containing protein [Gaetbulibacter sp. S0825]